MHDISSTSMCCRKANILADRIQETPVSTVDRARPQAVDRVTARIALLGNTNIIMKTATLAHVSVPKFFHPSPNRVHIFFNLQGERRATPGGAGAPIAQPENTKPIISHANGVQVRLSSFKLIEANSEYLISLTS